MHSGAPRRTGDPRRFSVPLIRRKDGPLRCDRCGSYANAFVRPPMNGGAMPGEQGVFSEIKVTNR